MTTLMTRLTTAVLDSSTASQLRALAVVLVIALVVQRELLRVGDPERAESGVRAVNIIAIPLLVMFVVVVVSRLASFL